MKTAMTASTSRVVDGAVERRLEVRRRMASAPSDDRLLDDEPGRGGGVGGQQPEGVGVADDGDPRPHRQRLVGEQLGDVEHLVEGVDLDHAGLPEHRVDRCLRRDRRRGPCGRPARPGWCGPDFTATTGLLRPTRRAIRENLRGLPIDSR